MPANAIYVGRGTKWGNHHRVEPGCVDLDGVPLDAASAVKRFRHYIERVDLVLLDDCRTELRGKDLACWCPLVDKDGQPVPCHADVLLALANR
jgi:hypothetical protein